MAREKDGKRIETKPSKQQDDDTDDGRKTTRREALVTRARAAAATVEFGGLQRGCAGMSMPLHSGTVVVVVQRSVFVPPPYRDRRVSGPVCGSHPLTVTT